MAPIAPLTTPADKPASPEAPAAPSVARRAFAVLVGAVLAVLLAGVCRPATAEASGYLTLKGVAGIDESVAFATLHEAVDAVAACDPAAQLADSPSAVIVVHGTVYFDASVPLRQLGHPVDGVTYALAGADAASNLVIGGGSLLLDNPAGSIVVCGLSVSGDLRLWCRDNIAVDACAFDGGLDCASGGLITVAGNTFAAAIPGYPCALTATLQHANSALSFVGNVVSGYANGLRVGCTNVENSNTVSVSSNQFDLAAPASAPGDSTALLTLSGGVWGPASIARDGNVVADASVLLRLDDSFVSYVWGTDPVVYEGVIEGNLSAQTVVSLFELLGSGTSQLPRDIVAVSVGPAYAGTAVAEQVWWASQTVLPPDPVTLCTVSYDPNGATAGVAPEPAVVEPGATVSVANMGSMVKPNCVFQGWNTAPDGSGTFYAVGQIFSVQGDLTLYAQWASTGTVATMDVASVEAPL